MLSSFARFMSPSILGFSSHTLLKQSMLKPRHRINLVLKARPLDRLSIAHSLSPSGRSNSCASICHREISALSPYRRWVGILVPRATALRGARNSARFMWPWYLDRCTVFVTLFNFDTGGAWESLLSDIVTYSLLFINLI